MYEKEVQLYEIVDYFIQFIIVLQKYIFLDNWTSRLYFITVVKF